MLSVDEGHDVGYLTGAVATGRESYYTGAVAAGEPPGLWYGAGAEGLGLAGRGRRRPDGGRLLPPARPARPGRARPGDVGRGAGPGQAAPQVPQRGRDLRRAARHAPGARAGGASGAAGAGRTLRTAGGGVLRRHLLRAQVGDRHGRGVRTRRHRRREGRRPRGRRRVVGAREGRRGRRAWPAPARRSTTCRTSPATPGSGTTAAGAGSGSTPTGSSSRSSCSTTPATGTRSGTSTRPSSTASCAPTGSGGPWTARRSEAARAAAGAIAERVMEAHLSRTVGARVETRADGKAREVVGVDRDVLELFSSRSRAIEPRVAQLVAGFEERFGHPPSPYERAVIAQQVTLATRRAKSHEGETLGRAARPVAGPGRLPGRGRARPDRPGGARPRPAGRAGCRVLPARRRRARGGRRSGSTASTTSATTCSRPSPTPSPGTSTSRRSRCCRCWRG